MGQFFFRCLLYLFVTCVGIASVRLGGLSIHNHNKGETMSKRPPLGTTGKLALAGKRNRACPQLLDCKQRERDRRDLLSLVGKNSSLMFPVAAGKTHHPATKGMLHALQALRRLVYASILIFVRMVLPTLPRKLYLMRWR